MKYSEAMTKYAELKSLDIRKEQDSKDNSTLFTKLMKQVTDFDIRSEDQSNKLREKIQNIYKYRLSGTKSNDEVFNGHVESDFSEENWKRLKKGKPFKLPKLMMPRRLNSRNSFEVYGRDFYIVKRNHVWKQSKTWYYVYDIKTRISITYADSKEHAIEKIRNKLLNYINILEEEE